MRDLRSRHVFIGFGERLLELRGWLIFYRRFQRLPGLPCRPLLAYLRRVLYHVPGALLSRGHWTKLLFCLHCWLVLRNYWFNFGDRRVRRRHLCTHGFKSLR